MNECVMKLRKSTVKARTTRSLANNPKLQKISKRRVKDKEKKCVCMPQRFGPVEFPLIWTEFRMKNQLCDGTILCEDGVQLHVHRAILSAVSSYFRAHFTNILNGGLPEKTEATVSVSSDIFTKILDFAYTGYCNIEGETVAELLRAADQYHVLGVVQLCCQYILDHLQPTNCLGILRFARHYFCSDLEKQGKRFVKHNFVRVLSEGREFDHLEVDEIVELLKDDELNVKSEEIVFDAIKKWIDVNVHERKAHLLPLLKCIRLGNLSTAFLTEKLLKWEPITESQECRDYLMNVLMVLETTKELSPDVKSPLTRPRVPYDILFAVGGWSAGSPTNFIETYDTFAGRWLLSVDTDDIPRAYHGLCALKGYIYMIGGFDGNEHFNTVRRFDPIAHQWKECACMYYPRCYVSVVTHDNKIYALGGYNGRIRMSSAERYDTDLNQWELIRPMQKQRSDASAAVLNDKIYIVGGFNGHEVMSSAEVYDTSTNQWTFIPHMISARSGVSLVAFKNSLYALGGFNGFTRLSTGEKLTPGISAGWINIAEMFSPRSNFATVVLDDLIFVIGGFNGSTTINFVECYDPEANDWFEAAPMNLNRSALSACVLSGLPNAKDYAYMGRSEYEVGQGAGKHQDVGAD